MDADGADDVLMRDRQGRQGDQRDGDVVDGVSIVVVENLLFLAEHLPAQGGGSIAFPGQGGELHAEFAGQERADRFDDHAADPPFVGGQGGAGAAFAAARLDVGGEQFCSQQHRSQRAAGWSP